MKALKRALDRDLHFLKQRGMRVTQLDDDTVLLEDLDEWLWAYQVKLMHRCDDRLVFNVYSQPTDACDNMSSFRVCIVTSEQHWCTRVLSYVLACVSLFVFLAWLCVLYKTDAMGVAALAHSVWPHAQAAPAPADL